MKREVEKRIIETMRERKISKITFVPDEETYEREHEDDPDAPEYYDYRCDNAPSVIWFDKYGSGSDYFVMSVELIDGDVPRFKMECDGEYDNIDLFDNDVAWLTILSVYERMEEELNIDDEPEYVWVFTAEQAYDYTVEDVVVRVFATEEAACKFLYDFIHEGSDDESESIEDFVMRKGWEVEINDTDLYRAFPCGRYPESHIECTITKCEIENKKYYAQ